MFVRRVACLAYLYAIFHPPVMLAAIVASGSVYIVIALLKERGRRRRDAERAAEAAAKAPLENEEKA